jgi:hypothetical protein
MDDMRLHPPAHGPADPVLRRSGYLRELPGDDGADDDADLAAVPPPLTVREVPDEVLRFAVAPMFLAMPLLSAAARRRIAGAAAAAIHDEIRKVRDGIIAAIGRGDVDSVLAHLHPNVVFTPMDADVCGPQEVRAYFVKMMQGPTPS